MSAARCIKSRLLPLADSVAPRSSRHEKLPETARAYLVRLWTLPRPVYCSSRALRDERARFRMGQLQKHILILFWTFSSHQSIVTWLLIPPTRLDAKTMRNLCCDNSIACAFIARLSDARQQRETAGRPAIIAPVVRSSRILPNLLCKRLPYYSCTIFDLKHSLRREKAVSFSHCPPEHGKLCIPFSSAC